MHARLAISLAAFVGWLLITVVGGQIHTGQGPLTAAVTRGLGWPFLLAALFLLVVVVWQQSRDVGLNKLASRRGLLLTWLPMLYIVVGLSLAVVFGLPPAGVLLWILFNTFLVGLSEELMFRGVLLQAFRHYLPCRTMSGGIDKRCDHARIVDRGADGIGRSPDIALLAYRPFRNSRSRSRGRGRQARNLATGTPDPLTFLAVATNAAGRSRPPSTILFSLTRT